MNLLVLGVWVASLTGQEAPAQLASAPTPAPAPALSISYQDALDCAANYQIHAGEAEMQGLAAAKKARFKSSDKAAEQAVKLGQASGKDAAKVDDELMALMDQASARPPSRAALTAKARRCDGLLALTTP